MKLRLLFQAAVALAIVAKCHYVHAQAINLPNDMRFSADGHYFLTGGVAATGLYDTAIIRNFYLEFSQANYWSQMQANYATRTPIPANLTVDGVTYDSVGVGFKGNTSYNNVQNSQKKSFNIDMNDFVSGQNLMGYKTLNLNNAFEDASFLREVFYTRQIRKHVPAAKANFVHLYINNADWGLYPNVQQVNKELLKEWFFSNDGSNWRAYKRTTGGPGPGPGPGGQWGDGTAGLNYLGADTALFQNYYTLKSSDETNPWNFLRDACEALNQTSSANLPTVLPNYFDIDRVLWFLACEIAFSDDDGYAYKGKMDYYVYHDPETGRMTPLEFDGNSVMKTQNITWSPFYHADNANYPLLNKILAVPMWRQRYLAHMRTILNGILNPTNAHPVLDAYKAQIDALVQDDPIKLYTYAAFGTEVTALKSFVTNRRNNLLANAEVAEVAPTISNAYYQNSAETMWATPTAGEGAWVRANVNSASGVFQVNLFYSNALTGNFSTTQMFDDGAHHDGAAGDGIYGGMVPAFAAGSWVRCYVEALANNTAKSAAYWPEGAEHDVFIYQVQLGSAAGNGVVINELMASNTATVADDAGEFDDWIELYNTSTQNIDLSGYYLTDNLANLTKWDFPANSIIPAGGYMILWADEDSSQGWNHMNFKLSAIGGEVVMLLDPQLNLIDSVHFGSQQTDMGYARVPNGTGPFVVQQPTFNAQNTPSSVHDVANADQWVRVYPNPANAFVNIVTSNPNALVEVTNMLGQTMALDHVNGMLRLSTDLWPNGIYQVRVGATVTKVVVAH